MIPDGSIDFFAFSDQVRIRTFTISTSHIFYQIILQHGIGCRKTQRSKISQQEPFIKYNTGLKKKEDKDRSKGRPLCLGGRIYSINCRACYFAQDDLKKKQYQFILIFQIILVPSPLLLSLSFFYCMSRGLHLRAAISSHCPFNIPGMC